MNAIFTIKVSIDPNNVTTSFGTEKIEDMDTTLFASVMKMFSDLQNKLKTQVAKFYVATKEQAEQPEKAVVSEDANEGNTPENINEQPEEE